MQFQQATSATVMYLSSKQELCDSGIETNAENHLYSRRCCGGLTASDPWESFLSTFRLGAPIPCESGNFST
jgi:hypothetical protein